MVKHNNVIPNGHFRKDWQRYIKTWFNQPAKKVARRKAREAKATKLAPRPIGKLRPVVRGQTVKYNLRVRAGRGFTLDELKAAGINKKEALGLGICVDHRRKNRSEEGFKVNVDRLKLYKSKLVVYPRNPNSKRTKAGDADKKEIAAVEANEQCLVKTILPIEQPSERIKARKITAEEKAATVTAVLRKALTDHKRAGARAKAAADKAEAAKGTKKKK
mmetsp:Transcript_10549/g.19258  ORF Transcript_10549/g.19258 Transcript_10549/m.19258 type:complete len:218 (-) Transcript_10549:109-762(-)|eukprot:CAMPEP_0197524794 /NCGR_PEP_ID=MMETSP1318-20131121/9911_1 /TAXON_ID=552666 /ORGANISM="Partenskyella glossopodia, Strain RCC365" /LENGTH=217 /DNA_ID=CAMNT_0043077839 /DNA_START=29 /DNA_END=682 /DNA_ORIENTATION=+